MKKTAIVSVLAIMLVLVSGNLTFAEEEINTERVVPEVRAYRINPHAPVVDGNLDDEVWSSSGVQLITDFRQFEPDEGSLPTESTVVAIIYDEDAIYVGFWCYDSEPDKIARQLVRRDRHSEADNVSVRLDPFHDHQTGYRFTVNASGVMRDDRLYNENNSDMAWDAVWSSGVQMQPWGWSAEMKIPYHCLRFAESDSHTWGLDVVRHINRKSEYLKWAFVPSAEGGFVRNFGHLTGLEGLHPARRLEVLPYVVSNYETEPGGLANPDGKDAFGNSGVDLKYGLTSNLTIDATINPDFGQVELDRPVLNLSTYETWFPERRPFFLEGADLWETEYQLFYSRRIGRAPVGSIQDPDMFDELSRPDATTILGAAKLTGKLESGTSIAFLSAVTAEEQARYRVIDSVFNIVTDTADEVVLSADTSFSQREGVVEPYAGYSVLRIKQDVMSNSSVGAIMTMASQGSRHPAVTGGFDWRLYTNDGVWYIKGQSLFSRVDPNKTGFATDITIGKDAGEHVRGAIGGTIKDPHLHINRLGYTGRNNVRHIWSWIQYKTNNDWLIVRNSWNNFNTYTSWNYDGDQITNGGNWNSHFEFTNNWSLGGGAGIQAEKYSDDETRGNGLWRWPVTPAYSWWLSLNTDQRKMVSFNFNPGGGTDRGGTWWANYVGVDFRPKSNMEFSLGANFTGSDKQTRWVTNDSYEDVNGIESDSSVFADLYKEQISINASASLMIQRNLSVQISAQGLISGLDYRNYRPYVGNNQYGAAYADAQVDPDNPNAYDNDFTWGSLNSTFLLRYEYRPGSTLYLVWTRAKSDFDGSTNDIGFSRDFNRFFSAGATNVFLVKASYWLNI